MKPPRFEYRAPATQAEALALLAAHGYDAKVLAGGQSLVPLLNFRLARPKLIIDINNVAGLAAIAEDPATRELCFGALVRQSDAERSPLVARHCPLLINAIRNVGHRTIRNRGTVGGSIAHADPSAELPLALAALGGRVRLASATGERWVSASDLFVSYLQTALGPAELLVEVRFPWLREDERWAFTEFTRRSGDFALAAVCVVLGVGSGAVTSARIAIAGGGPTPVRATQAEVALVAAGGAAGIAEAARLAAAGADVESDIHASADYRRELIATLVTRAIGDALGV
ncbi:MAG TPA: FAD binding domain-containing protein [Candidatus Limnocylindria bacterium]|nr:FAD binding domain-containing protein [Candidatus Limnocylindria bacterium]